MAIDLTPQMAVAHGEPEDGLISPREPNGPGTQAGQDA